MSMCQLFMTFKASGRIDHFWIIKVFPFSPFFASQHIICKMSRLKSTKLCMFRVGRKHCRTTHNDACCARFQKKKCTTCFLFTNQRYLPINLWWVQPEVGTHLGAARYDLQGATEGWVVGWQSGSKRVNWQNGLPRQTALPIHATTMNSPSHQQANRFFKAQKTNWLRYSHTLKWGQYC